MRFNYFLNYLKENFSTNGLDEVLLKSHVQGFQFNKKTELLHPGEVCKYFYFIEEGMVRTYEIRDNKEDTLNYYRSGHFFSSFRSFLHQVPCAEGIVCENEVRGVKISYNELLSLRRSNPYFTQLSIQIYEKLVIELYDELNAYRKSTADERYDLINSSHPKISTISLQKNIASFLGVTNSHYSAIKHKALKQHLPPKPGL